MSGRVQSYSHDLAAAFEVSFLLPSSSSLAEFLPRAQINPLHNEVADSVWGEKNLPFSRWREIKIGQNMGEK